LIEDLAYEDAEHTQMRVKLYKRGFSHDEITSLFETVPNLGDLHNPKRTVEKAYEIMNYCVNGNDNTLGLIEKFVKFLMANQLENVNNITVTAKRNGRKWLFIVGAS
jgi:hypothetical protein